MNPPVAGWNGRPVVGLSELEPLGPPVSEGAGESLGIYPVPRAPGWLVKLYNRPGDAAERDRLDWLIALPDRIPPADRDVLRRNTSWPVARVTDRFGPAAGVVLPMAPVCFGTTGRYLEVDVLAKPDHAIARRGLPVPAPHDRLAICTSLAATGAALERQSLVYSDWSYSNAFWSPTERAAYLIDVDGVGLRAKPNLHQPNWQDPLTGSDRLADGYTDRYRLALLVARCLTGQRDVFAVLAALNAMPGLRAGAVLLDILMADERMRRPTVSALHVALLGMPYLRMPLQRMPMPTAPVPVPHRGVAAAPNPAGLWNTGGPAQPEPVRPGRTGALATVLYAALVICAVITILMWLAT
jgi:hypothetical protein